MCNVLLKLESLKWRDETDTFAKMTREYMGPAFRQEKSLKWSGDRLWISGAKEGQNMP